MEVSPEFTMQSLVIEYGVYLGQCHLSAALWLGSQVDRPTRKTMSLKKLLYKTNPQQ